MNPRIAELSRLCSYPLLKRWRYDWSPIEADLGFVFPTEYKDYVSYFPPGLHAGAIIVDHPALRESSMDLPGSIRLSAGAYAAANEDYEGSMPFYPKPGGLIPWAQHEGIAGLCWLPDSDDPDSWPVIACNDENEYEPIPGSTIEALIHVLREEAGRSVFPATFYQDLASHGAFMFDGDEGSPLVDLGPVEYLDPPAHD